MFSGSLVAIATPMRDDGAIDPEAWSRLLDFQLENGTSGVVIGGTTGESVSLSDAELEQLVVAAREIVRGRIPLIVGAGLSSTAATVERVRRLAQLGVDGLLVVTPAYNRPTQEGLYRHFAAVTAAANVPVILYNVPSRTAVDLLPETVVRLSQLRRLTGVKEAVASMDRIRALVHGCRDGFVVLSGDDASAREAVAAGARGVISVTANVAPRAMADMISAALRGDASTAASIDARLASLHRALFIETSPIPVKWALTQLGLAGGALRLPLTELSAPYHGAVRQALTEAAVL